MKYEKILNLIEEAKVKSKLSPDMQTKVGCIIVDQEGGNLLSSYNGFITKGPDQTLPKTGEAKLNYMIHAEENAICRAARRGIALDNTILICTHSPCKKCMRLLYQSGVRTIYFDVEYKDFQETLNMKDIDITANSTVGYTKLSLSPKDK